MYIEIGNFQVQGNFLSRQQASLLTTSERSTTKVKSRMFFFCFLGGESTYLKILRINYKYFKQNGVVITVEGGRYKAMLIRKFNG